jgi:orotidine-5'-phosphate decarboxylase
MNSYNKLINSIETKHSLLCVGLDSDINKIPSIFTKNIYGLYDFNKTIIENTNEFASAYKINFAFYEQYGSDGFALIKKTLELIPDNIFTIADAKRGDIGNTSASYAKSVFQNMNFDSVTLNPYMGRDTIIPFIEYKNKMVFILALTSNQGSNDFQRLLSNDKPIYLHIIEKIINSFDKENIGFVIGSTHPNELAGVRRIIPEHTLLIPGVGVQGGNIEATIQANNNATALINVSRGIIYPKCDDDNNFIKNVKETAEYYRNVLKRI